MHDPNVRFYNKVELKSIKINSFQLFIKILEYISKKESLVVLF